jgi:hypothetical protein
VLTQSFLAFHRTHAHQQGGPRDVPVSVSNRRSLAGLCRGDRLLAGNAEPPLGAHLVTPRLGFTHHGIYVGGGKVVHYGVLVFALHGGPVEEVSLARFSQKHAVWIRFDLAVAFAPEEVIRRARSRIGEYRYRLLSNNCEHFCEWCLHDEHRSYQVDRLILFPQRLARLVSEAIAPLRAVQTLRGLWS